MSIVERIKLKCKEQNTNIKTLEREIGIANGSIRRWENQKPSYDKIILVAEKLNVTVNWLIFGKEASELSPDEQKLIEYYRKTDERGKRNILRQAEAEAAELESSNSKIG